MVPWSVAVCPWSCYQIFDSCLRTKIFKKMRKPFFFEREPRLLGKFVPKMFLLIGEKVYWTRIKINSMQCKIPLKENWIYFDPCSMASWSFRSRITGSALKLNLQVQNLKFFEKNLRAFLEQNCSTQIQLIRIPPGVPIGYC